MNAKEKAINEAIKSNDFVRLHPEELLDKYIDLTLKEQAKEFNDFDIRKLSANRIAEFLLHLLHKSQHNSTIKEIAKKDE